MPGAAVSHIAACNPLQRAMVADRILRQLERFALAQHFANITVGQAWPGFSPHLGRRRWRWWRVVDQLGLCVSDAADKRPA